MKNLVVTLFFCTPFICFAQNCYYFKANGELKKFKACEIAEGAEFYYQFSREYQQIYDSAIETCPSFATAYHAKSVAYLKSGNFIEWKKLIDKAVELKPEEYLGVRASCRYQFIHDYEGAIDDIEQLMSLINYDLGYTSDGDYHLDIVRAICYKQTGNPEKAIRLFEAKFLDSDYEAGVYDHYHLGVLYYEQNLFGKAIAEFQKQISTNPFAEVYYYQALTFKELNQLADYKAALSKSEALYAQGNMLKGTYTAHFDKIYLQDIKEEIRNGL